MFEPLFFPSAKCKVEDCFRMTFGSAGKVLAFAALIRRQVESWIIAMGLPD
jgi:hypothetical protein